MRRGADVPEQIDALAKRVIGASIEVHRALGPGFLESVYSKALACELNLNNIPFECEKTVHVTYKGFTISEHKLDLLVDEQLVVELKSVDCFLPIHTAQTLSYLKATGLPLGLLINFHVPNLGTGGIKRVVLTR
jgi:GxxExxY protein